MTTAEDVLDAVEELTVAHGRLPSLLEVATSVGLTKQGVLHHFPTRAALDAAVTTRALSRVGAAMTDAAAHGSPTETYLHLSSPTAGDHALVMVLMAAMRRGDGQELAADIDQAVSAWQAMIADEVGDPVRAEVVRLVGDGLFSEALVSGNAPSPERLARLTAHLRGAPADTRSP